MTEEAWEVMETQRIRGEDKRHAHCYTTVASAASVLPPKVMGPGANGRKSRLWELLTTNRRGYHIYSMKSFNTFSPPWGTSCCWSAVKLVLPKIRTRALKGHSVEVRKRVFSMLPKRSLSSQHTLYDFPRCRWSNRCVRSKFRRGRTWFLIGLRPPTECRAHDQISIPKLPARKRQVICTVPVQFYVILSLGVCKSLRTCSYQITWKKRRHLVQGVPYNKTRHY